MADGVPPSGAVGGRLPGVLPYNGAGGWMPPGCDGCPLNAGAPGCCGARFAKLAIAWLDGEAPGILIPEPKPPIDGETGIPACAIVPLSPRIVFI